MCKDGSSHDRKDEIIALRKFQVGGSHREHHGDGSSHRQRTQRNYAILNEFGSEKSEQFARKPKCNEEDDNTGLEETPWSRLKNRVTPISFPESKSNPTIAF